MHSFTTDAARSLPGPGWLAERRAAAAERFAASDPPTAAAEEWRYSAIADFDLAAYRLAGMDASLLPDGTWAGVDPAANGAVAAVLDVADGRIVASTGLEELSKQGVRVGPLVDAADGAELLGSVADGAADYFTVLNDAFTRAAPWWWTCPTARWPSTGWSSVRHLRQRGRRGQLPSTGGARRSRRATGRPKFSTCSTLPARLWLCRWWSSTWVQAARLGYLNLQQHDRRAWQIAAHTAQGWIGTPPWWPPRSRSAAAMPARETDTRLVGRGSLRRPAVGVLRLR